jgi:hypothetical protein
MFVETNTCDVRLISYQAFFTQDTGRETLWKDVSILDISSINSSKTSNIFKCSVLGARKQQGKEKLQLYLHEIFHKQGGLNFILLSINTKAHSCVFCKNCSCRFTYSIIILRLYCHLMVEKGAYHFVVMQLART